MNTTTSSGSSKASVKGSEDNPLLHPGRELCYYFKSTHNFLAKQVKSQLLYYSHGCHGVAS